MDKDISYSSVYRRFLIGGGVRVVANRFFSIFYTVLVARIIAKDDWGILVLLASAQILLVVGASYGLTYSSVHFGLGKKKKDNGGALPIQTAILLGIPTMILLTELLVIGVPIIFQNSSFTVLYENPTLHLSFLISNILAITLEGFVFSQKALLRSDYEQGLRLSYSVLNSLLVPFAYHFFQTVVSVVITWNIIFAITILIGFKFYPEKKNLFKLNFPDIREIVIFGFIVNLATLANRFSFYFDRFVVFIKYEAEVLSDYYWGSRIATIGFEFFSVVVTGVFPLLTRMEQDRSQEDINKKLTLLFKMGVISSAMVFSGLISHSDIAIQLLLGNNYKNTVLYLQIFSGVIWFQAANTILYAKINASATRKRISQLSVLVALIRIIYLTIGNIFTIETVIIALILTYMTVTIILLSMQVISIPKKTIIVSFITGIIIYLLNILNFILIDHPYWRILSTIIIYLGFIFGLFKLRIVEMEELNLIKSVIRKKKPSN